MTICWIKMYPNWIHKARFFTDYKFNLSFSVSVCHVTFYSTAASLQKIYEHTLCLHIRKTYFKHVEYVKGNHHHVRPITPAITKG